MFQSTIYMEANNMKVGFLGAGAMGGAILSGALKAGVFDEQDISA